ncbi:MAG: N-glycosylase/DNA lyase [Candidatus Pacearchaeota archaeon]
MNSIIELIEKLKNEPVSETISQRMKEFEDLGKKHSNEIFKELCFCLLTANFSAAGGIKIQNEIGDGFLHLTEKELATKLSDLGHRFPNARAKYILESQKHKDNLKETLTFLKDDEEARDWLIKNIKGLGMKEASHFLRNIGYKNVAILDFHIIDLLVGEGIIERPKTLTPKRYLEIENSLKELSEKTQIPLGELDLYLWHHETGKVLK